MHNKPSFTETIGKSGEEKTTKEISIMATKAAIERRIEKMEYPNGKKDIQAELHEYKNHIRAFDKKIALVIARPEKTDSQISKEALELYEEYGAYHNFLNREHKPLPEKIRQKLDEVYGKQANVNKQP